MENGIQARITLAEGLERMVGEQDNQDELKTKLAELVDTHRELDKEISRLHELGVGDSVALGHLKREKLLLKDEIRIIEDQLLPDIIA